MFVSVKGALHGRCRHQCQYRICPQPGAACLGGPPLHNPALFSRWFIVEGFTTPASRVNLDPRPGGTISAVMVPDEDGPEIPFTAAYGIVEPPRRIQFKFTDPTETVTISLLDLAEEGTQLTYSNVGAALTGRAEALIGVERMLDALESSLADLRR
jgi:uncharacterized protein YndB with AHSA1/START domain